MILNMSIIGGNPTKSTLIITIETDSTVQLYSDNTYQTVIKTALEKNTGEYWFSNLDNGTYYIKAIKETESQTQEYTINEFGVYRINMYYLPDQAINYTLLYDGSLGEEGASGANTMPILTGGYTNQNNPASYGGAGTNYSANVVQAYADCTGDSGKLNSNETLQTINTISTTGYQGFGFVGAYIGYQTNLSDTPKTTSIIQISLSDEIITIPSDAPDSYYSAKATYSSAVADTTKRFYYQDFTNQSSTTFKVFLQSKRAGLGLMVSIYNAFMYKSDDTAALASRLGLTNNTTSGILADTNDLTKLFATFKAVKTMCLLCTGDFMVNALNNSSFLAAYNSSEYKSIIDSNEHWAKFLTYFA